MLEQSVEMYRGLEAETGQAVDWHETGSLRLACSPERVMELRRLTTMAKSFGLPMEVISAQRAQELFPLMSTVDVLAAAFLPTDGYIDPASVTIAIAKGARQRGARIVEQTRVERIEEPLILAAHRLLRSQWPTALLLWAPRHPERFDVVAGQCAAAGWQVARRTTARLPGQEDAVFVIDTLGELLGFLAMADVAFVGGSLQPVGGHNVLEPAALGLPVLVGPHMFNFAEATALQARARQAGASGAR